MSNYPRGSEWRQWDLHVHSPASYHWNGQKFQNGGQGEHDEALIDQMIQAMNTARPAVFALMDYWSFDGWFALKRRLAQSGAPQLKKTVFPGIELRLCAPMQGRLNAHAVFSDEISDQELKNFLSYLKLQLTNKPLSKEGLIEYARQLGADKLSNCGFTKEMVLSDYAVALEAGHKTAELAAESYKAAIENMPEGMAIGFMPFSTNDGLASVKLMDHYAYVMSLFRTSPIFETRDEGNWNAFVGHRNAENDKYFKTFQDAIKTPRLPVSGSDAHCFVGDGTNDKRGYGDYPSDKITWIKADPTWRGLLQAIKEPKKRCFIGVQPPKASKVNNEKTSYIDRILIYKDPKSNLQDSWFDGCDIELNTDLVAIIGNKGTGKSALADVIALLGRSQEGAYFSFLKDGRFKGKTRGLAHNFIGKLVWKAGEPCSENLADEPSHEKVELVKYIPQGRFEALCNEHVSGASSVFEQELRKVIFSHIPTEQRLGSLDFDQLVEQQEKVVRATLNEKRNALRTLNETIIATEDQLHPSLRMNLEEQIALKDQQIAVIQGMKPKEIAAPPSQLTEEQQRASAKLHELVTRESIREENYKALGKNLNELMTTKQAIKSVLEQIGLFETQFEKFSEGLSIELNKIGLKMDDVVKITIKREELTTITARTNATIEKCKSDIETSTAEKQQLEKARNEATKALDEPQKRYQAYLEEFRQWQAKLDAVEGDASNPDSKAGLHARLDQILSLPQKLDFLKSQREKLSREIYTILDAQRKTRADLFVPVQELITCNELIREEYKLQFQANLVATPDTISLRVFSIIKQSTGEFRGEEESKNVVKSLYEQSDIHTIDGAIHFVNELLKKIEEAAKSSDRGAQGIRPMLRKDRNAEELYSYLFGLEFIEPKYSLLFQDTPIEQLSPGQRGALLLIFYLLVDRSQKPIILDQPEENLDNETIVSLLVPVIEEAKKYRQIIMVTHNPNLAVVCDAEQVIVANFERNNASRMSYYTGSIENSKSNKHIIDILEGTKPAFDNRCCKYFTD